MICALASLAPIEPANLGLARRRSPGAASDGEKRLFVKEALIGRVGGHSKAAGPCKAGAFIGGAKVGAK